MKTLVAWFFIASIFFFSSCQQSIKLKREKFDKIEIGMSINEVKSILGEPDKMSVDDDSNTYYFYLTQNDIFAKRYASVKFDRFGWVSFRYYGKQD